MVVKINLSLFSLGGRRSYVHSQWHSSSIGLERRRTRSDLQLNAYNILLNKMLYLILHHQLYINLPPVYTIRSYFR